jgi:colanic acid biosynthesis glycosyl transferase WcaI
MVDWDKIGKMRILVVPYHYMPDGGPSAPLYAMLCQNLSRRGHEVTVIATVPHYPTGRVPQQFRGRLMQRSYENGVNVIRLFVPSLNRADLKKRFIQFLFYQVGASLAGLKENYDVLLFSNPSIDLWLPFIFLSRLRHKPAIASVHDVYPDVGITLGIFRHQTIISAVSFFEKYYLQRSTFVRILSESFLKPLQKLGIPKEKMVLVYDWVDTDLIRPLPKNNNFAIEHCLDKHFVVMYAGNIGFSQGLEHVLDTADLLKNLGEIKFVFVGDGAGRDSLIKQTLQRNLSNVEFLPFQPRPRLPEVLATADISLVSLQKGVGLASLPSKTFSILASGRPILASVDEGSDTWKLLQRSEAGICIPPEDPMALSDAIKDLKKNPSKCESLGKKGRQFALENHSPQAAAGEFEKLLFSALSHQK